MSLELESAEDARKSRVRRASQCAVLQEIVRLTAGASSKGTHNEVKKDETERYIIYTYSVVGDLLALNQGSSESAAQKEALSGECPPSGNLEEH